MTRVAVTITWVILGIAPAFAAPPGEPVVRPTWSLVIDGACARPGSLANVCGDYTMLDGGPMRIRRPPDAKEPATDAQRQRAKAAQEEAVRRLERMTRGGIVDVLK